jgi:hypothetical protein
VKIRKVALVLDKPRTLLYDVNAMIDLGEALNLNLMTKDGWDQLVGHMETPAPVTMDDKPEAAFVPATPSFDKIRAIVWAGLRHEDEALTVRQVGAMLDPTDLGRVIAAYTEAWQASDVTASPASSDPNASAPASVTASA